MSNRKHVTVIENKRTQKKAFLQMNHSLYLMHTISIHVYVDVIGQILKELVSMATIIYEDASFSKTTPYTHYVQD